MNLTLIKLDISTAISHYLHIRLPCGGSMDMQGLEFWGVYGSQVGFVCE